MSDISITLANLLPEIAEATISDVTHGNSRSRFSDRQTALGASFSAPQLPLSGALWSAWPWLRCWKLILTALLCLLIALSKLSLGLGVASIQDVWQNSRFGKGSFGCNYPKFLHYDLSLPVAWKYLRHCLRHCTSTMAAVVHSNLFSMYRIVYTHEYGDQVWVSDACSKHHLISRQ